MNTRDLDGAKRLVIAGAGFWLMGSFVGCTTTASCRLGECERDAQIAAAVEGQLAHAASLHAPNFVGVQSKNHVAYVYGLVDTATQERLAVAIARQTPGVGRVVDSIEINDR